MIKVLLSGLWVCVVTLLSCYGAIVWQSGQAAERGPEKAGRGLETVKPRMFSVPIVVEGAVQGYVVAQFEYAVDPQALKRLALKPDAFFTDEAFRTIYAGEGLDFRHLKKQELPQLSKKIAENVNKRLGVRIVEDVLILDLNYVPKDQTRGGHVP